MTSLTGRDLAVLIDCYRPHIAIGNLTFVVDSMLYLYLLLP